MTKSLSKILKSGFVSFTEEKRIIQNVEANHPRILRNPQEQNLEKDNVEIGVEGLNEESLNPLEPQISLEEIEQMKAEAVLLKEQGYEEGKEQGYEEGKVLGQEEGYQNGIALAEQEYQVKVENLEQERAMLQETMQAEYEQLLEVAEKKVAGLIEGLLRKLIAYENDAKGTILHLVKTGLNEVEISGDIVIKVSVMDYDMVIEHKNEITNEFSEKVSVEILKDSQLSINECVIETNMGTIDCGLGTQLENLLKQVRMIQDTM